jgi:uncharacterized RDD family membrane protein YckC
VGSVPPPPPSVRNIKLASTASRAAGFFIDAGAMVIVPAVLFVGWGVSLTDVNNQTAPMSWCSWVWLASFLASLTVFVTYPAWFIGRRGQTPGMQKMGIRLFRVNKEGTLSPPNWANAWGRSAVAMAWWLILFFGPAIDYLWSFEDGQRQCLHDKFGRTVAVQEGDRRRWDELASKESPAFKPSGS